MAKEYRIESIFGDSGEPTRLRIFGKGESPVEIALRKEDFDYLGEWKIFGLKDAPGYDFAYRLGLREKVRDDEGDLTDLAVYFYNPLVKRGFKLTREIERKYLEILSQTIHLSTLIMYQTSGKNTLSCLMRAPRWMTEDLASYLRKQKEDVRIVEQQLSERNLPSN